ncbi:MAG: dephospho-CoA kinase [Flavobacteriaceae bacterium]|nr:dephospho-CoA kinase [Flavobacteriaceae bacterium]
MTKILGLTGGIGSGKTAVSKMFNALDVPVYNADQAAKILMQSSKDLKHKIKQLLGEDAYKQNQLNKVFISEKIFNNKALLTQINALVHPEVALDFNSWLSMQTSVYVVKELAILFETAAEDQFDYILTVTAPEALRIQRIIERDHTPLAKIKAVMSNQLQDSEKTAKSDFVILNIDLDSTNKQVYEIHNRINKELSDF